MSHVPPGETESTTTRCHEVAEEFGASGDLVLGADTSGFLDVAEAVHALGLN